MTSTDEKFLTVAEIAASLRLNQQTVRNWIDAGTLPALHVGRRVRVARPDLEALLEQQASACGTGVVGAAAAVAPRDISRVRSSSPRIRLRQVRTGIP